MRRRNLGWGLMSMPWSTEPNLLRGATAGRRSSTQRPSACFATSKPALSLTRDHFGLQSNKDWRKTGKR